MAFGGWARDSPSFETFGKFYFELEGACVRR